MSIRVLKYYLITIFLFLVFMEILPAQNLSKHQWENRILLIEFDDFDQKNYQEQIRDLQVNLDGLTERKLIIYQIHNETFKVGFSKDVEWQKMATNDLKKLKKKPASNFSITLIGLDGGVKEQKSTVFDSAKLFEIIDAMPMRVWELRKQNK